MNKRKREEEVQILVDLPEELVESSNAGLRQKTSVSRSCSSVSSNSP